MNNDWSGFAEGDSGVQMSNSSLHASESYLEAQWLLEIRRNPFQHDKQIKDLLKIAHDRSHSWINRERAFNLAIYLFEKIHMVRS